MIEKLEKMLTWGALLEIGATVVVAIIVSILFKHYVLRYFERMASRTDNDVDDRLVWFVRRFYKGILVFVVLVVVLKILDIELTPLLAGAGIAGIAVAYAAQDIIGNFLSGVFLLVDRPIKIGDRIRIERIGTDWGTWGDVVDVGLRSTTVRNTDGVLVTYPNAKLAESIIKNFSPVEGRVRFRIRVMVDLNTDLEHALDTLVAAAREHSEVLDDPEPHALVWSLYEQDTGHMGHGVLLELRCFVGDIRVRSRLRSRVYLSIHKKFREEGIQLARMLVVHTPLQGDAAAAATD